MQSSVHAAAADDDEVLHRHIVHGCTDTIKVSSNGRIWGGMLSMLDISVYKSDIMNFDLCIAMFEGYFKKGKEFFACQYNKTSSPSPKTTSVASSVTPSFSP